MNNVWILSINEEGHIKVKGVLDEIHSYKTQHCKSKFRLGLCRNKSYQRTDIEKIRPIFDQVWPSFSNLEFHLTEKPLTPNNIVEAFKGPLRQLWK